MLDLLAWTATASILLTYALSVRKPFLWGPRFHLANALGCLPLAWLNYKAGVLPALVVNLGFGIPAWYAVSGGVWDRWAARGPRTGLRYNYGTVKISGTEVQRALDVELESAIRFNKECASRGLWAEKEEKT